MMQWFGKAPWAPLCDDCPHVKTPVGQPCGRCDEPIAADDDGVLIPYVTRCDTVMQPLHYECNLRQTIGGLNHLLGRCTCCGGTSDPDPPHMTKRQAAKAAATFWTLREQAHRSKGDTR